MPDITVCFHLIIVHLKNINCALLAQKQGNICLSAKKLRWTEEKPFQPKE